MKKSPLAGRIRRERDKVRKLRTPADVYHYLKGLKVDSPEGWRTGCRAILDNGGPDFYALRDKERRRRQDEIRGNLIGGADLTAAADARKRRFCVIMNPDIPLWYGRVFNNDWALLQPELECKLDAERAAARKAIWLVGRAAKAAGGCATLRLAVADRRLCTGKGEAAILLKDAERLGVDLKIKAWSRELPAVRVLLKGRGYLKWDDNLLNGIIKKDGTEV